MAKAPEGASPDEKAAAEKAASQACTPSLGIEREKGKGSKDRHQEREREGEGEREREGERGVCQYLIVW